MVFCYWLFLLVLVCLFWTNPVNLLCLNSTLFRFRLIKARFWCSPSQIPADEGKDLMILVGPASEGKAYQSRAYWQYYSRHGIEFPLMDTLSTDI